MKIVYITTWGRRCGLSTYAEHRADEWLKAGHTVWVLDEKQGVEANRAHLPPVEYVACWQRTADPEEFIVPCLNEIAYIDPDVVIFSHDWHEVAASTLKRLADGCHLLGCPLLVGWHNLVSIPNPAQELPDIDGHIVYHPDAPAYLASVGVDPERVAFIPHGCGAPVQAVGPDAAKGTRMRLATFGLMYPTKGLDQVVLALAEVRRLLPERNVTLDIYSSFNAWTKGEYDEAMAAVQEAIDREGLGDCVNIWAGFPTKAGLLRALNEADVVVLLYRDIPYRLSSSGALPEALAAARPVVTSNIAHFAGTEDMGDAHMTVADVKAAAERIAHLLTCESTWRRYAKRAQDHARAHTYADAAAMYLTLAEKVTVKRQGPSWGVLAGEPMSEDARAALRGVCVRPYDPLATPWEDAAPRFPAEVEYVFGLAPGDTPQAGWDLDIRRALRTRPKRVTFRGGGGPFTGHRRASGGSSESVDLEAALLLPRADDTKAWYLVASTGPSYHRYADAGRSKVGVVIPTYRRPAALRSALLSVGTGVPVAVVSDDGPPGHDVLAATSGDCVSLLHGEVNHGASWARNRGVEALETVWVQFLDDDDLLVGGWRESLLPHLADGVDAVVCSAFVAGPHALAIDDAVFTSQVCVRRASLLAAGGFTESKTWAEERDLLARMEGRGMVVRRLALPLVFRPQRGGSGQADTAPASDAGAVVTKAGRGGF